jgi:hypothetical protein
MHFYPKKQHRVLPNFVGTFLAQGSATRADATQHYKSHLTSNQLQ